MTLTQLFSILKGGSGSGNIGHVGIPGHRGGSAPKNSGLWGSNIPHINSIASGLKLDENKTKDLLNKAYSYKDEETGYRTEPTSISPWDMRSIEISGMVYDKDDNQVGAFQHIFTNDRVYIRMMAVNDQGKGFGSRFHQNAEEVYKKMGVTQLELSAEDVGGYAWARLGFDFQPSSRKLRIEFSKAYKERYKTELEFRPENPYKAYEIAAMVGPDGTRFGKEFLLGKQWEGVKKLNDEDVGYQVGQEYYKTKSGKK